MDGVRCAVLLVVWLVASVACVPAPFRSGHCHVDEIGRRLQENFSLERFMGTWYTLAHVQRTHYPYQRRSHYGMNEDGTISMKTNRVMRRGDCNSWFFEARGEVGDDLSHPAMLLLYPPIPDYPPEDYWIVGTDYTTYAIVYSCGQQRVDGSCTRQGEHAWLMGRAPGNLSQETRDQVSEMMSGLCIQPHRLSDVPLDCDKELRARPNIARECLENGNCSQAYHELSSNSPCRTSSFRVQKDFTIERFLGEWYEIAHTRPSHSELKIPDMRSLIFGAASPGENEHLSIVMKDIKLGGVCSNLSMPGLGWLSKNDPAKIVVQFPIPEKYGVSGSVEYWILATDYTDYAVTYSCHRTNADGTCDKQREALWVLSRTPTLPRHVAKGVDEVVRGVCLDPVQVTENQEACYTDLSDGNYTSPVLNDQAALSSGDCDPEVAKFGCCLLNGMPATGPNYQGCPRVQPPLAGLGRFDSVSNDPGTRRGPIGLTEPGERPQALMSVQCDDKIICKIYCENGFERDKNGCFICMCAKEQEDQIQGESAVRTKMTNCLQNSDWVSSANDLQPQLDCEPDGSFSKVQCHNDECWCVDANTGYELANTRGPHDFKPDCNTIKTQLPKMNFKGMRSDCRLRLMEAQQSFDYSQEASGSFYLPACDERGLYRPVQCDTYKRVCWCVDAFTGEEAVEAETVTEDGELTCAP